MVCPLRITIAKKEKTFKWEKDMGSKRDMYRTVINKSTSLYPPSKLAKGREWHKKGDEKL